MTITAAADGSALGNPGPNGWAWYIDESNWAAGGTAHGTNNQGELTAVLELLRATRPVADQSLVVECDSKYVIDSVTKWMAGWKRNGWRTASKQPVKNRELIEALDAELQGREVRFVWVKGHAGHPLNEAADERANAAARAYQAGELPDAGPGFTATPRPNVGPISQTGPKSAQNAGAEQIRPTFCDDPAQDSLFGEDWFGDEPTPITVTLELSPAEFARLQDRARALGLTVDAYLRTQF